jgi:hypothetical protein
VNSVSLLADLEEFVTNHRPHGSMTGDATEPAWNGYLLTVACSCGVVFGRWVTPADAELDAADGPAELTAAAVDRRPVEV